MKRPRGRKSRSRSEKAQRRYATDSPAPTRGRQSGKTSRPHTGRVQKNPRGFAFVIPVETGLEDAYVGPREAATLMNDDIVEYTILSRGRRQEARIERVIKRGQKEILGEVRPSRNGPVLSTERGELHDLDGARDQDIGQWVIATIEEYPNERRPGLVSIKETLGRELKPKHDIPIAISRFGLEEEFSHEAGNVADGARRRAEEEMRRPHADRRDQRHLPYVTIDGEDAKDFDDAVLVEMPDRGPAFILYVAIADVSFFVERGSALDRDARKRGTSVYFPGFCLPMLPEALSNDLCSLRPQSDRLAFTAEMHFDRDGRELDALFYPSVIRTAARLTYNQVHSYLEKRAPEYRDLQKLGPQIEGLQGLYRKLAKQRIARGVLDFDLPECKIEVDAQGNPTSVHRAERYDSHKLIEEFMIAANRAVAKVLRESRTLALYRVHEPPDLESLEELNTTLRNLGISSSLKDLKPQSFAKILEATRSLPSAPTLHQAILRMQKQAHYEPEPKGHFGLALRDYAHFTSPIRRYPDLVVHRSLRGMLTRHETRLSIDEYIALGEQNSQSERRAMEAERWVVRRKQCWFMQQHLGQKFTGRISSVTANGLFVEIPEFATDGYVPIEFLTGSYQLDERNLCLRRRPGNQLLKVGDPLEVEVVKVSVEENQITLGAVAPSSEERSGRSETNDEHSDSSAHREDRRQRFSDYDRSHPPANREDRPYRPASRDDLASRPASRDDRPRLPVNRDDRPKLPVNRRDSPTKSGSRPRSEKSASPSRKTEKPTRRRPRRDR